MKRPSQIYKITIFLLLNFVILFAVESYSINFTFNNKSDISKDLFHSIDSFHLLCPNSEESEDSSETFTHLSPNNFTELDRKASALTKIYNDLAGSKSKQYQIVALNFPVKLQKTHIIFPSHYFW